ncbi:FMN-linked oxidoreductase [Myriangium duriaei CBS 260.36]|uniref:FMN-linked oxidoreductase n=1 Tax=Myriangium duriaei CBS 260.36 TaxID=1168546 RepID=A0A9P4J976_9PEZI|nr:FMN-linked oxidoreductase [Myriangium duriaei CBS 260.36]
MVRSGECPSRLLALHYGADLVWGPETVDRALIGTTRRVNPITGTVDFTRFSSNGQKNHVPTAEQTESVIYRLHPQLEGRRLIHQIGTASPDLAVQAASLIAADVAGIDVNAGCPKPFSTLGGMGAALLKTPDILCNILTALVEKVGRPHEIGISVKIRILDTPEQTRALVERLVKTGITGLTVHCRTTPMRPRERAIRDQLSMVAEICHEAGVACLMNGDVTSRDEALSLAAQYGADGGMIATAAETNSSCFRAVADGGKDTWQTVVAQYVRLALDVDNRWGNTKYLLGQIIPGKSPLYNGMKQAKSYRQIVALLELHEELGKKAAEVDERLGLDQPKADAGLSKAERKAKNKAEFDAAQKRRKEDKGAKRSASEAGLENVGDDRPAPALDQQRQMGPGSVTEQASVLAV